MAQAMARPATKTISIVRHNRTGPLNIADDTGPVIPAGTRSVTT